MNCLLAYHKAIHEVRGGTGTHYVTQQNKYISLCAVSLVIFFRLKLCCCIILLTLTCIMADAILSELEWDDGLAIPIANAENKQFEEEVSS